MTCRRTFLSLHSVNLSANSGSMCWTPILRPTSLGACCSSNLRALPGPCPASSLHRPCCPVARTSASLPPRQSRTLSCFGSHVAEMCRELHIRIAFAYTQSTENGQMPQNPQIKELFGSSACWRYSASLALLHHGGSGAPCLPLSWHRGGMHWLRARLAQSGHWVPEGRVPRQSSCLLLLVLFWPPAGGTLSWTAVTYMAPAECLKRASTSRRASAPAMTTRRRDRKTTTLKSASRRERRPEETQQLFLELGPLGLILFDLMPVDLPWSFLQTRR